MIGEDREADDRGCAAGGIAVGVERLALTRLGPLYLVTHGFSTPEVEATYSRANELLQESGDVHQLFPILFGRCGVLTVSGEFRKALAMGRELLLAERSNDSSLLVNAHRAIGIVFFYLGDLSGARTHLEAAVSHYEPRMHHMLIALSGDDSAVASLSYLSWTLWLLGYPEQALRTNEQALALARKHAHPPSLAFATGFYAQARAFLRERGTRFGESD